MKVLLPQFHPSSTRFSASSSSTSSSTTTSAFHSLSTRGSSSSGFIKTLRPSGNQLNTENNISLLRSNKAVSNGKGLLGKEEIVDSMAVVKNPLSKLLPKHVATRGIQKKEVFSQSQHFSSPKDEKKICSIFESKANKFSLLNLAVGRDSKAMDSRKGFRSMFNDEEASRKKVFDVIRNDRDLRKQTEAQKCDEIKMGFSSKQYSDLSSMRKETYPESLKFLHGRNKELRENREVYGTEACELDGKRASEIYGFNPSKRSRFQQDWEKYEVVNPKRKVSNNHELRNDHNNTKISQSSSFDEKMFVGSEVVSHKQHRESNGWIDLEREAPNSSNREHFHRKDPMQKFVTFTIDSPGLVRNSISDRNELKKSSNKNILKPKDLSLKPIKGEPHSEYVIRRKGVMNEAENALMNDVDDCENVGDDWIKKRLGWLCKEIPVLKASGIVKMLNKQKKWIKQDHISELIEHLIRLVELNRAHRVLKWMRQQPFYKFEYDLHDNMAYILGRNNKISRCQDVFDEIVRNGIFPSQAVFTALIKAYLQEGDKKYIDNAWKLYNQMLQLGLTVSLNLSETLLKSLTCPSGQWLREAEELLEKMKDLGYKINEEMYTSVLEIHGKKGDHYKVDSIISEMDEEYVEKDVNILNAVLAACAKDGNTRKAEETWEEIIELGLKPNWRTYAYLIQAYGKASLPNNAWRIFEKMKGENIVPNFVTYESIINVMAEDGKQIEKVLQLLKDVESSGIRPLQPAFNAVMSMYLRLKMYKEVEDIFNRGKAANARPSHAAFNMLINSYIDQGELEKAEGVFEEMKRTDGMGPNSRTYNLLLKGYGIGCFRGRVKEIFEEMTARGCQVDPDVKIHIKSMVGVKNLNLLEKQKLKLTDEQREIIPGLLLGGAKMENPEGDHSFELHLEFDSKNQVSSTVKGHLAFLFQSWWKTKETFAYPEVKQSQVEEDNASSVITRLETISHTSFKFYANQYRPNGEPVIPRLIHRWLRPRTLAYWYMYGGYKCPTTGGIVLNASKYPVKQIQLVVKTLKSRTMECKRKKKSKGDVIRIEGRSAGWLWKLMEPHILESLKDQLKPQQVSTHLCTGGDIMSESDDIVSSDEDDWEDLEEAKREEMSET